MPIFLGKNKVSCKYLIPTAGTVNFEKKAVNFYDYDGTLLHSYTKDEALGFNELPSLPDRTSDGLTCQGWNYTLDDIKTDLTTNTGEDRWIDVGAMYIPTDGATLINITMADKYRSAHSVRFAQTVANGVTIDWGDGTEPETYSHTDATTVDHEYAIAAAYPVSYTIKMTVADGCIMTLGGNIDSGIWCNITGEQYYGTDETHYGVKSARIKSIHLGKNINTIVENTFQCCDCLQYITIPNNVTVIEGFSFWGSHSLRHITIPNGVESIGISTFQYCRSLISVTISNSVKSIGQNAFIHCYSITSITIPTGVSSIDAGTFYNCSSLASITIPNGVTSIGNQAFYNCYSLASITIPNGVTSIGGAAFDTCYSLASVTIPNSVTSIGNTAFSDCYSLASISIPNGVTSIGSEAFYNCYSLATITIPNGVTSISGSAFRNCYALAAVTIPNGVSSVSDNAFAYCYCIIKYDFSTHTTVPTLASTNAFTGTATDKQIVVPDNLYDTWIAATNWSDASIKPHIIKVSDYDEPQYVPPPHTIITYVDGNTTEINVEDDDGILTYEMTKGAGNQYTENTTIQSVEIGSDVTSIGEAAFRYCTSLTSITIPEGVTEIGASVFYYCSSLTSITIPSSVTSIGDGAFAICSSLTSITIPEGVTSIGMSAFSNCSGLTSVAIPSSVTSIGISAFSKCPSLNDITFDKTMEEVSSMTYYSWVIKSGKVIKCTDGNLTVS